MEVGKDISGEGISMNGEDIETVEDFCYLGSFISYNRNSDKEIRSSSAKTNSIFGRLGQIWANMGMSNVNKFRLNEALVLSTLLYGSETWPMTVANMKRIEAAHHKWQRKILRISWKEIITNEEVRARSGQMKLDITLRQRRLSWWLGHVHRMDAERIPRQAMEWRPNGKRGRGRPRMTWYNTVEKDLSSIGLSWDIAAQLNKDRQARRSCDALWAPHGMD